jgi:glycosyl-4,4'-diaponeurosporenoate acyltransferase
MVFWPAWTFAVGYVAHRVPADRFADESGVTRARAFERDGAWYRESMQIERWKDRLPEAGALFPGGYAKRSLDARDPASLATFVIETRRAETAHWGMAGGVLVTLLWNPWWAAPVNLAVAAGSNVPCIAVQRYNRARLTRLLCRLARPRTP